MTNKLSEKDIINIGALLQNQVIDLTKLFLSETFDLSREEFFKEIEEVIFGEEDVVDNYIIEHYRKDKIIDVLDCSAEIRDLQHYAVRSLEFLYDNN